MGWLSNIQLLRKKNNRRKRPTESASPSDDLQLREESSVTDVDVAPSPDAVPEWKRKMISDFSAWMTDLPDEPIDTGKVETASCDLYTLLTEFISLRQEIRMQNREQHNTLRTQHSLIEDHHRMIELFKSRTEQLAVLEENIRLAAEKKTILPFLIIRDALVRGLESSRRIATAKGFFRRPPRGIGGIVEGYEMALRRFDRALSYLGIEPLESVGTPFDPASMKAVGKRHDDTAADGIVLEERLTGFIRGPEILRTAEVVVNTA